MSSTLKILFLGDIVGQLGRKAAAAALPQLKRELKPDLVIANVENLAHGQGVTPKTLEEALEAGIDFFTSGNHIWKKKEVLDVFKNKKLKELIVRPANYPAGVPGSGDKLVKIGGKSILVINLLGRVFIRENTDCPFKALDKIIKRHSKRKLAAIIVDFHAEATSEKVALGFYADGRVSAVLGTHTHVPTGDARILPGGTACISDVGMIGGKDTVLGVERENIIENFLTQMPKGHLIPESGACLLNGVYLEVNPRNGQAVKIIRIDREVNIAS